MKKRNDKKVYYIGWYIAENDNDKYTGNVPGNLKMHYVANKIIEAGHSLRVLSLAHKKNCTFYGNKRVVANNVDLTYIAGCSKNFFKGHLINNLIKQIILFFYILFVVKPQDTIVVYHSELITRLVAFVSMFVKRRIICEVEEVYGFSASGDDWETVKKEFSSIKKYDSFILINDYLHEELEIPSNNYIPCYGVVNIPERRVERINDGYIHIVYAGTIEGKKKGAYQAVEAAEYLPKDYKLHVIGFGKQENINALKEKIEDVNRKQGYEMVIYDGFKSGDELDQYLYSCHIGISTYVLREAFANNSLPSKIFTYMCHDLAVVRGFAPAYEGTEIAQNWTFYYEDTAQDIAKAIMKAKIPPVGLNTEFLKKCDRNLIEFLKEKC